MTNTVKDEWWETVQQRSTRLSHDGVRHRVRVSGGDIYSLCEIYVYCLCSSCPKPDLTTDQVDCLDCLATGQT